MPFTLSHPAAVIPFRRFFARHTSLCALVIGSMSPDLVYFFPLGVRGSFSHSAAGIFLFCVPASLVAYIVFYLIMRQPLIALMPEEIGNRLPPQREWFPKNLSTFLIIASSFVIGAGTHVAWDAFTHGNTLLVKNFEVLRTPIGPVYGLKIPLYKVLQHLSTSFGLIVLVACTLRWMRRTPPNFIKRHRLSRLERILSNAGILATGFAGGIAGVLMRPARTIEHMVFNGVVNGMASMALAIFLFCVFLRLKMLQDAASAH